MPEPSQPAAQTGRDQLRHRHEQHNHPSGDPAPSSADVQVTRQLREAARALDIELLDHVILGQPAADPRGLGWYSFRQAGLL